MCTHEECPLSDGDLEDDKVVCYCHSGEFDVRTGAVLKGPPEDPIPVYELREENGELQRPSRRTPASEPRSDRWPSPPSRPSPTST